MGSEMCIRDSTNSRSLQCPQKRELTVPKTTWVPTEKNFRKSLLCLTLSFLEIYISHFYRATQVQTRARTRVIHKFDLMRIVLSRCSIKKKRRRELFLKKILMKIIVWTQNGGKYGCNIHPIHPSSLCQTPLNKVGIVAIRINLMRQTNLAYM